MTSIGLFQTPEEIAQRVRRHLSSSSASLSQGRSHCSGLVEVGGKAFFVKLCKDQRRLPRLQNEHCWLKVVHSLDPEIVPRPIAFEKPGLPGLEAFLVIEPAPGRPLVDCLNQKKNSLSQAERRTLLISYGRLLARFHALPSRSTAIRFDGEVWSDWKTFVIQGIDRYLQDIRRFGGKLSADDVARIRSIVSETSRSMTLEPLGPIHGDATPWNVLVDPRGFRLIDLEVTHHGDPLMDLSIAGLLWLDRRPSQWEYFLCGYGLELNSTRKRIMDLYRVARLVRLLRGKIWIHNDRRGFAAVQRRLSKFLENISNR